MSTKAIDWQALCESVKSICEAGIATVNGRDVQWFVGRFNLDVEVHCPYGSIWLGDSEFPEDEGPLGKEDGRLQYREHKDIHILLCTYKVTAGQEDSIWANAHGELEDLLRLTLDAVTADTSLGGEVRSSRLVRVDKAPPELPEDEEIQGCAITIRAWKNWYGQ